ncbi:BrnA antitoxin family protein [Candidatus Microgenomates bacterium]|nr:BrnA antitoxin family protein [Candidatus Microgenomates bacterium]
MPKKSLKVPKFKNEDEERKFWDKVSLDEYFDSADFVPAFFPNLKPSSQSISLRLPSFLLVRLKEQANELDVPYQSLIKRYIKQGIAKK